MSSKHKVWLIGALIAVSTVLALVFGTARDSSRLFIPSTFSAGPGGCKALYLLLEKERIPVARYRKPYTGLSSQGGALMVVEPAQVRWTAREIGKLKQWIADGNRLLLFEGGSDPRSKQWTIFGSEESRHRSGDGSRFSLARELGLRLKRFPDSSRTKLEISSPRVFEVHTLSISNATRWSSPSDEWTVLAADDTGPAIVSKKLGKGEVWAVADATTINNRNISQQQNVRLVPAVVLEETRPAEVLFDEYHHGYVLSDSFWTYAGSTVFAWIMIQAMVGGALFFYSRRARYAGRFRSLAGRSGRSSMEYVSSMAHIFEASNAGSLALESLLNRFLGRLARKAGVPLKDLDKHSVEAIAMRTGLAADCAALVEQCRRAVESHHDSAETLELAKKLAMQGSRWTEPPLQRG